MQRRKLIAANSTQLLLLVAAEPSFSDELLTRALIAAASQGMKAAIALNKIDLPNSSKARIRLKGFERAGYQVIELAALPGSGSPTGLDGVRALLSGEITVLAGQSGMGKSTLINALFPAAAAATREISRFLDSGRHTTTFTRLYALGAPTAPLNIGPALIDTPGIQEFGLAHIPRQDIASLMPDIASLPRTCRFADCRHRGEPDCAVRAASESGALDARRYELFLRISGAPY